MGESIKLSYDKEHAEAYLGAAIIAFHNALRSTLHALAEVKGTDDMGWFDELHREAVRSAKGTVTEEVAIETEAPAMRFGFESIEAAFQHIRLGLIKK